MFHPRPIIAAFLLSSGALAFNASAQDSSTATPKAPECGQQEIGINLFSWINIDLQGQAGSRGDLRYASGLLYKWHCHRNVFRAGVDVLRNSYTIGTDLGGAANYPEGQGYRDGQSTDTRIRLGYERRFGDGRLQPYAGMDVGFRYFQDRYYFEGMGGFVYNPTSGTTTVRTQQVFIAPFVGLDYHFANRWSVAMELAVNYFSGQAIHHSDEYSILHPDGESLSYGEHQNMTTLDPVRSFCLVYHF